MKLLKRYINWRDGTGDVTLVAEDDEDMWHIYNLIQVGDRVRTTAQRSVYQYKSKHLIYNSLTFTLCMCRKVTSETSTGSTSSQRVTTMLTVEVEAIDYDGHASIIHLKGKNVQENQHVKVSGVGSTG